ncbi:MAG: hypothetical protein Q9204_007722 [Flavoplaca sp. TL-2023a]
MSSDATRSSKLGVSGSYMGLTGKIIKVLVGPAEAAFNIHWGLLTSKSTFFNAALTGFWRESSDDTVRLVEEVPELFAIYVVWIYNQDWTMDNDGNKHSLDTYCRLYVLANVLGSEALENLIIDQIRRYFAPGGVGIPNSTIYYIYDTTLPESPLRRLLVDVMAYQMSCPHEEFVTRAPQCLHDVVQVFVNHRGKNMPDKKPYATKGHARTITFIAMGLPVLC